MTQNYTSLHVHSDYSFLDSIAKVGDLTKKAKDLGMSGLAITEHGNICSWMKFYDSCHKNKIKPILGMEAYICDDHKLPKRIEKRILELEMYKKDSMGPLFEFGDRQSAEVEVSDDGDSDEEEIFYREQDSNYDEAKLASHDADILANHQKESKQSLSLETVEYDLFDSNDNMYAEEKIKKLKELKKEIRKSNHLIILAKNKTGYNNLMKLSTNAWLEGSYFKPRIDIKLLEEYKEGLIVLSACLGGQISSSILKGNLEKAENYVKEYKRIFNDDFYIELQLHEIEEQKIANKKLLEFSEKYNIKTVITQDVHYIEKEDVELHQIVVQLRHGTNQAAEKAKLEKLESKKRKETDKKEDTNSKKDEDGSDGYFYSTKSLYFKSIGELISSWKKDHSYIDEKTFNESIDNTNVILDKVESYNIKADKPLLPHFDTGGLTAKKFMINLIKNGVKNKLEIKVKNNKELQKLYEARIKEELDTICDLNFEQYFLIVWDYIKWCRENSIGVGGGRGSVAGSLIAYLLDITQMDSVELDLMFSRFINKQRSGAKYKLEFDDIPLVKK